MIFILWSLGIKAYLHFLFRKHVLIEARRERKKLFTTSFNRNFCMLSVHKYENNFFIKHESCVLKYIRRNFIYIWCTAKYGTSKKGAFDVILEFSWEWVAFSIEMVFWCKFGYFEHYQLDVSTHIKTSRWKLLIDLEFSINGLANSRFVKLKIQKKYFLRPLSFK